MNISGKFFAISFFSLAVFANAQAAPSLECQIAGQSSEKVRVDSGNGSLSLKGAFTDKTGKSIRLDSCQGDLIGSGQVPGFGDNVETFWLNRNGGCPFEFLQVDDSVYSASSGPMRLSCNQTECATAVFLCSKHN
jgi:hypothetical protein